MLSLQRCREIVGWDCLLDDDLLVRLRDQLYGLADVITGNLLAHRSGDGEACQENKEWSAGEFKAALTLLPECEREDVEERAAIIEFEGGTDRDQAERRAILSAVQKRHDAKERN